MFNWISQKAAAFSQLVKDTACYIYSAFSIMFTTNLKHIKMAFIGLGSEGSFTRIMTALFHTVLTACAFVGLAVMLLNPLTLLGYFISMMAWLYLQAYMCETNTSDFCDTLQTTYRSIDAWFDDLIVKTAAARAESSDDISDASVSAS